ncbi:hypothetical protein F5888DRAFT_1572008, partial [Russula emetica]
IARRFNLHRTTIPRLITRFKESGNVYYRRSKPGHPRKLQERDAHHAAIMFARTEAANCTELVKKAFPHVSRQTMFRALHEYGLVSRV